MLVAPSRLEKLSLYRSMLRLYIAWPGQKPGRTTIHPVLLERVRNGFRAAMHERDPQEVEHLYRHALAEHNALRLMVEGHFSKKYPFEKSFVRDTPEVMARYDKYLSGNNSGTPPGSPWAPFIWGLSEIITRQKRILKEKFRFHA